MPKDRKQAPTRSEAGMTEARDREARLSGALRDNLLKRKMQQRARADLPEQGRAPERPEAAEPSTARKP